MAFAHVFFSVEDVVIQVVRLNDVRDALAFVSTCRTLRQLHETKAFWLHVVSKIAQRRPLPMPLWELPENCTASALRVLAQQAYRIRRVLSVPSPSPVDVTRSSLPDGFALHTVIPVTSLALVHNSSAATLACVNLKTGWCSPAVPAGTWILNESDFRVVGDTTTIAFQTSAPETRSTALRVYAICAREGAESIDQTWSCTIDHESQNSVDRDVFLDADVVGFIVVSDDGEVRIRAWNMRTASSSDFRFPSPLPHGAHMIVQAACVIIGQLCLNFVYRTDADVLGIMIASFPDAALPYQNDVESRSVRQLSIVSDTQLGPGLSLLCLTHSPICHWAQTLSAYCTFDEDDKPVLQITSLAYSPFADSPEHLGHDILTARASADSSVWPRLAWDGPTLAFIMQDAEEETIQHIIFVQFDHPTMSSARNAQDSITLAKLEQPSGVDLRSVENISVDGRLGIVHLQVGAEVYSLRYA